MTPPRPPSEPTLQLDERPTIAPDFQGGEPGFSLVAPVDAVGIFSFDPANKRPHLVFASEGLAGLINRRVSDLIGHGPDVLFGPDGKDRLNAAMSKLGVRMETVERPDRRAGDRRGGIDPHLFSTMNPLGTPDDPVDDELHLDQLDSTIDLSTGSETGARSDWFTVHQPQPLPGQPPMPPPPGTQDHHRAVGSSAHSEVDQVVSAEGRQVPVHVTYSTFNAQPGQLASIVVELRDLEQPSAEQLLADQAAVVQSLNRGHELGRLCHQVATQLERELDDGSRCWISVAGSDQDLKPLLAGDLPFDTVAHIMAELASLGRSSKRRLVSVDVLSGSISALLRGRGVRTLWYLPLVAGAPGIEASAKKSERRSALAVDVRDGVEDDDSALRPGSKAAGDGPPEGTLMGAVVVVTPRERPNRAAVRLLDHLTSVMQVALGQATAEANLTHQTLHDPLTGLPNRVLLVDRLAQAMARLDRDGVALTVFLVDIDGFKSVNDSHGADVGDKVLLQVAARLLGVVRLGDTVGRLSSDQYLLMCVSGKGELDPAALGRRVLRSLAEPIRIPAQPGSDPSTGESARDGVEDLRITASVGVVVVDRAGPSPEAVISNAESALAVATTKGRGAMAFFKADLQRHSVQRHQTEQALHRAIAQDELVIHYQPLVEIRTGFMVGAEALVRWDRPGHGLLSPGAFIPLAEESDLIVELGNWVINEVCRDLRRWPRSRGRAPVVTVNLGARQVTHPSLVPAVEQALAAYEIPSSWIGFEVTESMEIQDAEEAVANLNRLKELGCRIAIDDFGIGHATLDYIRRFSMADALKIDRSFVAGLGRSQEDTAIVNASIALATSLGLQVVAEGVETVEQLDELRTMGARYAQGFLLARPMPFEAVLEQWQRAQLTEPSQD